MNSKIKSKQFVVQGLIAIAFFLIGNMVSFILEIDKKWKALLLLGIGLLYFALVLVVQDIYKYISKDDSK